MPTIGLAAASSFQRSPGSSHFLRFKGVPWSSGFFRSTSPPGRSSPGAIGACGLLQHERGPSGIPILAIGKPAPPGLAPDITGLYPLLEQRRWTEALSIGFVQNLVDRQTEAGRRDVHQLEGADRVPEILHKAYGERFRPPALLE